MHFVLCRNRPHVEVCHVPLPIVDCIFRAENTGGAESLSLESPIFRISEHTAGALHIFIP
jgi:hypothetical protein